MSTCLMTPVLNSQMCQGNITFVLRCRQMVTSTLHLLFILLNSYFVSELVLLVTATFSMHLL